MKKRLAYFPIGFFISLVLFCSCNDGAAVDNSSIATDSASIALGQSVFTSNCSGCHNFRQDGIGPQLGGITGTVSADWIKHFIKDPKNTIESGDDRAHKLFEKFHTVMPSFASYSDADLDKVIAYLHTQKISGLSGKVVDPNYLRNPIPDSIALSDLVVGLEPVAQIPASAKVQPLTRIAKLDFQPNTDKLFILDLRGKLYKVDHNQTSLYMDMAALEPRFINEPGLGTGFGSFAFHPEFARNGLLYTTHTEPAKSAKADFSYEDSIKVELQWVLTEWKTDHPEAATFSGKGRELLRINMVSGIHGVQEITFNPLARAGDEDYGQLFIGIGDGGSVESGYPFIPHSQNRAWGTILRIDPQGKNSANGHYGISDNNPFSKNADPKTVREIYAYGFRNPHRITWSRSGQMLASNIGHGNIESLNLIVKGHDYGWPVREGSFVLNPSADMNKVYSLPANDSAYHFTYPVAEYDHGEGNAISGGYEYWGKAVPQLAGKYLFGDIVNGRLFYVNMKDLKSGSQAPIKEWKVSLHGTPMTILELCGCDRANLRFGRDDKGEIYVFTKPDGKLYKLVMPGK